MDETEVVCRVAVATGMKAQEQGLAAREVNAGRLHAEVSRTIERARRATAALMEAGVIEPPDQPI